MTAELQIWIQSAFGITCFTGTNHDIGREIENELQSSGKSCWLYPERGSKAAFIGSDRQVPLWHIEITAIFSFNRAILNQSHVDSFLEALMETTPPDNLSLSEWRLGPSEGEDEVIANFTLTHR